MWHLFHKYRTEWERLGTATFSGLLTGFKDKEEDIIVVYQKCSCGKDRAFMTRLCGVKHSIDVGFLRRKVGMVS